MNWLKRFLTTPAFEDEEKRRAAGLLHVILLTLLGVSIILLGAAIIAVTGVLPVLAVLQRDVFVRRMGVLLALILLPLGGEFLMRRGHIRLASIFLSGLLWLTFAFAMVIGGGVRIPAFGGFMVLIVIMGLLLGRRAGAFAAGWSILTGLGFLIAELEGSLSMPETPVTPALAWIVNSLFFVFVAVLLNLADRGINEAIERAGRHQQELIESNRQLQAVQASLEERVAERTRELEATTAALGAGSSELEDALVELQRREKELEDAVRLQEQARRRQQEINRELEMANESTRRRSAQLQATAEVGRAIAQVRDPDELLPQVTELISRHFGFYHAGIFLVDEARRYAVLRAANSQGGQRMLARGHRLPVGEQGIVGYVTGSGRPRVALDVGADAVFFDNPDMPETRSEMALPLRRGGEIIGALDVQSTQAGAFDDQDVAVLQTLADQISIALENAELFAQAQDALAKAEAVHQQYLAQEWAQYARQSFDLSHEYLLSGRENLAGEPLPAGDEALQTGSTVILDAGDGHQSLALAVPIKQGGQVIGVLDLQETDEDRSWSQDEIALAQAVAEQLALSLESARLFEQTKSRAHRESLTRQITDRIRDAVNIDVMLQTAIQELGRALGAPRVYVRLGVEAGTETGPDPEYQK